MAQKQEARLENWYRLGDRLVGQVYGHPRFEDGELITTSAVLREKQVGEKQLAETVYTYYMLGNPKK
jgi:hypothetical protein